MSNPYDITSGFVGAMEASAKKDRQAMEREQYSDRRAAMIRAGLIPKDKADTGIFEQFYNNLKNGINNVKQGFTTFLTPSPDTNGVGRLDTGGASSNMEAPDVSSGVSDVTNATGEAASSVVDGASNAVDGAAEVFKADGGLMGLRRYADGSPGGVMPEEAPAGVQAPVQEQAPEVDGGSDGVEALKAKSPYLALYKEDPKKAEQLYEQVSDFKRMTKTLKEMAAYDFVDGKGSEGLQKATLFLRQMQKEGIYEAALKASHGDIAGAKKAYLEYGDYRDLDFDIVPREAIRNNSGVKGGKEKYKVFDVIHSDGTKLTLDVQNLALEALSAKEFLERGDKEFDKDYKRAGLGLQERELGLRAESNRIAQQDRRDRQDEANFNRGIQLGNQVFEGIVRSEIAPIESKIEKEMEPFKNLAAVNPTKYAQERAGVEAKYAGEVTRRKNAFEAARQRYLIGMQKGEKLDPYALYSNAYKLFGQQ